MTDTRYVNPWTTPDLLHVGDRAANPGSLTLEWDGRRGIPVCPDDDLAMAKVDEDGDRYCNTCGMSEQTALWIARRSL